MNEPVTWQVELPDTHHRVAVGPMTASYAIETDEDYLILYEPSAYVLPGTVGVRQVVCTGVHSALTLDTTLASPSEWYTAYIHECRTRGSYELPKGWQMSVYVYK